MTRAARPGILSALALIAAVAAPARADQFYLQTNIVSNRTDVGAAQVDPNLRNPWGISRGPATPFWVSNQASGNSTLYTTAGTSPRGPVAVPAPTGQVFNSTSDFVLGDGAKANFLFASLNGSIYGWNPALPDNNTAVAVTPAVGAHYTGLALANNGSGNFLYAADDPGGKIDVFDGAFSQVTLAGGFTDPNLPAGFTPYNIQAIGSKLYVTYEHEAAGGGVVDAFDFNGNLLQRISANDAGGPLDSPWGLALAPSSFGPFGGALLVGNEGDGHISAFDPTTGAFLGQLSDQSGNPLANTGLWGLTFGNGGNGGRADTLYFAAGINDEVDGLFGSISAVPEPTALASFGLGAGLLLVIRRRRGRAG